MKHESHGRVSSTGEAKARSQAAGGDPGSPDTVVPNITPCVTSATNLPSEDEAGTDTDTQRFDLNKLYFS